MCPLWVDLVDARRSSGFAVRQTTTPFQIHRRCVGRVVGMRQDELDPQFELHPYQPGVTHIVPPGCTGWLRERLEDQPGRQRVHAGLLDEYLRVWAAPRGESNTSGNLVALGLQSAASLTFSADSFPFPRIRAVSLGGFETFRMAASWFPEPIPRPQAPDPKRSYQGPQVQQQWRRKPTELDCSGQPR